MSKTLTASATLIGTIIGAGILGIPYVIMKSGFGFGLIHLIALAIILALTTLYLGEIALRTKTNHHLTGYAKLYLGEKGKKIMFAAVAFGIISALIAYLIGEGESFSQLFFNTAQYSIHFAIAFWIVLSILIYFGIKALEEGETIGIILIFIMVVSIAIFSANKISIANLTYNNLENMFLPFGVILFAYLGLTAIPELERILGKNRKPMRKSIILAYVTSFILYTIFAIAVLGLKGYATPQIATLSLGKPFIFLGILTIFTSYLALSTSFLDTLHFDFNISKLKSWLYTIFTPLIIYIILQLLDIAQFTKVLGIGGVISGGLMATLILLMIKKAKKLGTRKPEYSMPYSKILTWILIAIFIIGAILEIKALV